MKPKRGKRTVDIAFEASPKARDGTRLQEAELLCRKVRNPCELVYSWVNFEQTLRLSARSSDEPQTEYLEFVFRHNELELGRGLAPVQAIRKSYRWVKPISEAILVKLTKGRRTRVRIDERWFKKRNRRLKPRWHEGICAEVVTPKIAVELAVSYALTDSGAGFFSRPDHETLYEIAEGTPVGTLSANSISVLDLFYSDDKTGRGWAEQFFVVDPL